MEPHREEPQKALPGAGPKPKRFRILKLEERIAPSKGSGGTNGKSTCACFTNGGAGGVTTGTAFCYTGW
jgi:hypothetical protein